ncbi:MAG TPA: hypothetical protein VH419_09445, partial [Nocardioidaceae bacterium]
VFIVGMGIAGPLAAVSPAIDPDDAAPGAPVGLWILSGCWGVATIAGILVIQGRSLLSPWLLVGLIPAACAAPFLF